MNILPFQNCKRFKIITLSRILRCLIYIKTTRNCVFIYIRLSRFLLIKVHAKLNMTICKVPKFTKLSLNSLSFFVMIIYYCLYCFKMFVLKIIYHLLPKLHFLFIQLCWRTKGNELSKFGSYNLWALIYRITNNTTVFITTVQTIKTKLLYCT